MAATERSKDALSSLMTAALALPGIQTTQASDAGYLSQKTDISYHHAQYDESGDRMRVRADQLSFRTPMGRTLELSGTYIRDITSGASPVINFLDVRGKPHQFLETGASIKDHRDIYEATLGHYGAESYQGVKLGFSDEDDYTSRYASVNVRQNVNRRNTTLFASAGYNRDDVWNSYNPSVLLEEPSEYHHRQKQEYMLGISQLLDRNSLLQVNLGYSISTGYLSDPYKKAYVVDEGLLDYRGLIDVAGVFKTLVGTGVVQFLNDSGITRLLNDSPAVDVPWLSSAVFGLVKDSRPSRREQWTALLRYSLYLTQSDSGLHLDYRYSHDSWHIDSHTLDIQWNKELSSGIMISPGLRYYTQKHAFFYQPFYETLRTDGYVSADYRLAGFGALSRKLSVTAFITSQYKIGLHYEYYDRRYSLAWSSNAQGDELDDFTWTMLSISLDGSF